MKFSRRGILQALLASPLAVLLPKARPVEPKPIMGNLGAFCAGPWDGNPDFREMYLTDPREEWADFIDCCSRKLGRAMAETKDREALGIL